MAGAAWLVPPRPLPENERQPERDQAWVQPDTLVGRRRPTATPSASGKIRGVDNGDSTKHDFDMAKRRSTKWRDLGVLVLVAVAPLACALAAFALTARHAGVLGGGFAVAGIATAGMMRLPRVRAALRRLLPQAGD